MLLNTLLPTGRLIRIGAIAFAFLLLAFLSQHLFSKSNYIQTLYTASDNLNIAVFATSGNYHLCQLHLSAALMGYPAHTLINWDDPEDDDPMKQHLAKIEGALRFLEEIPASQQDDLVFMVDGYDLWFQLPHSYIVNRYREVVTSTTPSCSVLTNNALPLAGTTLRVGRCQSLGCLPCLSVQTLTTVKTPTTDLAG
jgi:hypothetical protein